MKYVFAFWRSGHKVEIDHGAVTLLDAVGQPLEINTLTDYQRRDLIEILSEPTPDAKP